MRAFPLLLLIFTFNCSSGNRKANDDEAVSQEIMQGQVEATGTVDEVKFYYETGELRAIQRRENGVRRGYEQYFYPNGILKYRIYFIGDRPWSVEEGNTLSGKEVDLGTLKFGTGSWKTYFDDGTPEVQGFWKNNQVDSTWTFYNEDGSVRQISNWSSGLEDGTYLQYHPNGKIAGRVVYAQGKKVSELHYYENGVEFKNSSMKKVCWKVNALNIIQ